MKKIIQTLVCILIALRVSSQEIVNLVLLNDDKEITEDAKKATSFILIEKFPDKKFVRLNYKMHRPLESVQTYSDSTLTILEGRNLVYSPEGRLGVSGNYHENKRDGEWIYYNDTFKVIRKDIYKEGVIIETHDSETAPGFYPLKPGETEATFPGGPQAWSKFLQSSLNPTVATQSVQGGNVLVSFIIDKYGYANKSDIFLRKSVEYVLDEEVLRIMYLMPKWEPAIKDGIKVPAYRSQPISFMVSGN